MPPPRHGLERFAAPSPGRSERLRIDREGALGRVRGQGRGKGTATDTDFLVLSYWAADLVASSTYKDRYEFANRVMQILDVYSRWPSAGKGHYCDIFEHHELDNFIEASYCS